MAPEILKYEPYGPKVDLWSTGAVLYEMAVGKPPFRAQNHIELINKIEKSKGIRFPDEEPQVSDARGFCLQREWTELRSSSDWEERRSAASTARYQRFDSCAVEAAAY